MTTKVRTAIGIGMTTAIAMAAQVAAQATTIDNSCMPSAVPCETLIDNSHIGGQLVQALIQALTGLLG